MRRYLLLLLILTFGISFAFPQTGTWSGSLEFNGIHLPLVFHFDEENPVMDSPAQGAKGIPFKFTREEGKINISIPFGGASFQGIEEDNRITGTFRQNGNELPLTLTPGEEKRRRPQTPDSSGPYTEEEVSFSNGDATLKGTLTLPQDYNEGTPVVLMVTGSGLQNRDEEILEHKPFAVIADALARNGIASLRYDDRGFGESTGDAVNCTTEDLMYDALAGVNLLRERFKKVGVLGHSEGGTIALMLASDRKVDFIVSMAGMVISGKETLLQQNRHIYSEAGYPAGTVDEYCRLLSLLFDKDEDFNNQFLHTDLPSALKQNLASVAAQINSPYISYIISLDMRDRLRNITCPVLALNGTKDTQVFYKDNLEALRRGLPSVAHNKIIAATGLNHLFQHCSTGSVLEYETIEETISPEILDIITSWIKSV